MAELDTQFMNRALKITSFNLTAKDFESLTYKKEIQYLFSTHFFPGANVKFLNTVSESTLKQSINALRTADTSNFAHLFKYNLKGVGPGEVMMYYILNKGYLGGGSSAGLDLVVGSEGYELKAVDASPQGYVNNFKVGGTFSLADIINGVASLKKKAGLGSGSEVNAGQLQKIYDKFPNELQYFYDEYAEVTYKNYFKNHKVIFLSNKNGGGYQLGDVIKIMNVKKNQIQFERITSGTIKPRVFFK